MSSSKPSRSRRNAVYGLPTLWGALMFLSVGCALWFSIYAQSPVDRWIAFLMIILVLLHLAESNNPFRSLEFSILPFPPPFAGESSQISVEIINPTEFSSEPLDFRIRSEKNWDILEDLPARQSRRVSVFLPELPEGRHGLPMIHVRTFPSTKLFRLWQILRPKSDFLVLPRAIDHGISFLHSESKAEDSELSHIESIVDERLMYKMDRKLFLKTGKPYYRKTESRPSTVSIRLDWESLSTLAPLAQKEQFSHWIKSLEASASHLAPDTRIVVRSPFANLDQSLAAFHWASLKETYAEWVNA